MNAHPPQAPLGRPALLEKLGIQGRVLGTIFAAGLLLALLAGQQLLTLARHDAGNAWRIQAAAQLATLAQGVVDATTAGDHAGVRAQLKTPIAQGNVLYAEYRATDGSVLREAAPPFQPDRPEWFARLAGLEPPTLQMRLDFGNGGHGQLALRPSSHAYEDFLWRLSGRLLEVLILVTGLLGVLIHLLLKRNLHSLPAAMRDRGAAARSIRVPTRRGNPPEMRSSLLDFNEADVRGKQLTYLCEQQRAFDSAVAIAEGNLDGAITYANELFCALSGYTQAELVGQNFRMLNAGRHDRAFFESLWETICSGHIWRGEICNRARDGRLFWAATAIIPIKDDDGIPQKYLSIRFDVTQRKLDEAALEAEKERWQVTLQSINDAVVVTDARNRVVYLNPSAESLLGLAQEDAENNSLSELMTLDHIDSEEDMPICFLAPEPPRMGKNGSARLLTRFGESVAISYSCAPLTGNGGFGAIYVLRDETERKRLLDRLRDMAYHDALTTLPNRHAVENRLAHALHAAREQNEQHAFCYIDLDQFKLVNDTCGHAVGDSLLQDIAQTMCDALPAQAYLGRLGGDEFGLILFDTPTREAIRICRTLVQRIRDFRFEHKGRHFTLGACAGIARIARDAASASDIMVQADMACYRAKSEGSGRVMLYEADEVGFRRLEAEMGWAADFARALETNQFLPYRQLIHPTSSSGQPHYEVLVRWQRNGMIEGPAKLLSALERYGQAPILDLWMVEAVITWLAAHPDDNAVYFINLSGKTIADESFLDVVCQLLDRHGVPGARLGFEVTETAAVVNLDDAQRLIQGLRPRGCQFALDDFGRDASSFFYLKHLPADYLKIDGAFVRGMLTDRRDQAIVRSITQLACDFGMQSIAEQVENADMVSLLTEIGVNYLQGYHVHRPEPLPGWQALISAQPRRSANLSVVK